MGVAPSARSSSAFRAIVSCRTGADIGQVSALLDWTDFEHFCAALLRAWAYRVTENLVLSQPRIQIDILARSDSVALLVDCKHWTKGIGTSALARAAAAQTRRASLLRGKMSDVEPMIVVILILSNERPRYVRGTAVVPVHALRDFLTNLETYSESLARF